MAVPENKEALLSLIEKNSTRLQKKISKVPESKVTEKLMDGHAKGTKMSINNLLSYLIGRQNIVLEWIEKYKTPLEIVFPKDGYKWNELGKLAQSFYKDYEDYDFRKLLELLDKGKSDIVAFIEKTDNKDLYETAWYGKWTLGRMIQFNTAAPYLNASNRIHKFLKSLT